MKHDFEGFQSSDFLCFLQHGGEKDVTEEDVTEWLEESERNPGHQILTPEEIADQVAGNADSSSSSVEEDEMPPKVPKLSQVCASLDTVLKYLDATSNEEAKIYYGHISCLREIITKEQLNGGKQPTVDTFLKPVTTASATPATPYSAQPSTSHSPPNSPQPSTSKALIEHVSSSDSE